MAEMNRRQDKRDGTVSMTAPELLREIKARLRAAFDERLRQVILYGSEARGEAGPDSDIDVLVLLAGPLNYGRDLATSVHAVYPLTLESGRPISPHPVDAADYRTKWCPLYESVRAEGVPL